jgi:ferrous iron transport protein B
MGLTRTSTGASVAETELIIRKSSPEDRVIALAGNPNVGKSTVFNALTGMKQHTGNWPGKTVTNAQGQYDHHGTRFIMVDIPGTYSLMANSAEEEVARDFICFGEPDTTVVVTDATCLERNLNLALQTLEITDHVVVCVNLLDEAKKKKIQIDLDELSLQLGIPVVGASARAGIGLTELMDEVEKVAFNRQKTYPPRLDYGPEVEQAIARLLPVVEPHTTGKLNARWTCLKLLDPDDSLRRSITDYLGIDLTVDPEVQSVLTSIWQELEAKGLIRDSFRDHIVSKIVERAEQVYRLCVALPEGGYNRRDRKIDRLLTSKLTGIPIMILLLGVIFWITITGANYPSELLSTGLFWIEDRLTEFCLYFGAPGWVQGLFVEGMYRTLAWVVSVMLPPMAIFFPLFTLLEDSGYLPRIAFNMDRYFKKAGAHGKQSLTMAMGFGCNACGVVGCRIIDSPRERLIATVTNNFVPCNGRFAPFGLRETSPHEKTHPHAAP